MKYLPGFYSEADAQKYSEDAMSIVSHPTGLDTKYLFSWIKHPNRSEWCLVIHDNYQIHIRPADQSKLLNNLDDSWWSDPDQITPAQKYRLWHAFSLDLIAEFNALFENLPAQDTLAMLQKFQNVTGLLQNMALGGALLTLQQIPTDAAFTQEIKDAFIQKIQTYLNQWQS